MICPACNHGNIEGVDDCESCGEPLTQETAQDVAADAGHGAACEPIGSVQAPPPVTVFPTATVSEVVDRLIAGNTSCALVVGPDGCLMGIFSERDLLYQIADRYEELKSSPIHEFMTPDPETLPADATIAWALNRMDLGGFRHIPIVDRCRPVGLVSVRDLLRHLAQRFVAAS